MMILTEQQGMLGLLWFSHLLILAFFACVLQKYWLTSERTFLRYIHCTQVISNQTTNTIYIVTTKLTAFISPPVSCTTMNFGALKSSDQSKRKPAGIITHWREILMWCLVLEGWSRRCPQQPYPITFQIVVIWMQSTALSCTVCMCGQRCHV